MTTAAFPFEIILHTGKLSDKEYFYIEGSNGELDIMQIISSSAARLPASMSFLRPQFDSLLAKLNLIIKNSKGGVGVAMNLQDWGEALGRIRQSINAILQQKGNVNAGDLFKFNATHRVMIRVGNGKTLSPINLAELLAAIDVAIADIRGLPEYGSNPNFIKGFSIGLSNSTSIGTPYGGGYDKFLKTGLVIGGFYVLYRVFSR